MARILLIILTTITVSLYFFPFELTAFAHVNTKMGMAGLGLFVVGVKCLKQRYLLVNEYLFELSLRAAIVSLIGFVAITYNQTPDTVYTTYILSMWVWSSAAYVVCSLIKRVHGTVSIVLVINYLATVCVAQSILVLLIDMYAPAKIWVDTYIQQGQDFLNTGNVRRLYGIGASLDVAGTRFAAVLIMIAFVLARINRAMHWQQLMGYIVAFMVISVVGNMVARTTIIGMLLALVYLLYTARVSVLHITYANKRLWIWVIGLLAVFIPIVVYFYNTTPEINKLFRFAFEGFFNWAEKGEWSVASTEKLKTMYVFPETLKTWIIGDGYFSNPKDVDPYFIGRFIGGYYMGTDVGYLRFIFYFGMIGLIAFGCFMFYAGRACMCKFSEHRELFVLLLLLGFIVWFKVSTDIFLVFALFLFIDKEDID